MEAASMWIIVLAYIVECVILPIIISLIVREHWSANAKRWTAIVVTMLCGVITALALWVTNTQTAAPLTPELILTYVFALIGGMKFAYDSFKSIGITSKMLDALTGIGSARAPTAGLPKLNE
jgi:drug/metabolite transporter (DMT)-like permease